MFQIIVLKWEGIPDEKNFVKNIKIQVIKRLAIGNGIYEMNKVLKTLDTTLVLPLFMHGIQLAFNIHLIQQKKVTENQKISNFRCR